MDEIRVSCPICGARYDVPRRAVPAAGRDVLCGQCGHAWFVDGDGRSGDPDDAAEVAPGPAASGAPRGLSRSLPSSVLDSLREEVAFERDRRAAEGAGPSAAPAGPETARAETGGAETAGTEAAGGEAVWANGLWADPAQAGMPTGRPLAAGTARVGDADWPATTVTGTEGSARPARPHSAALPRATVPDGPGATASGPEESGHTHGRGGASIAETPPPLSLTERLPGHAPLSLQRQSAAASPAPAPARPAPGQITRHTPQHGSFTETLDQLRPPPGSDPEIETEQPDTVPQRRGYAMGFGLAAIITAMALSAYVLAPAMAGDGPTGARLMAARHQVDLGRIWLDRQARALGARVTGTAGDDQAADGDRLTAPATGDEPAATLAPRP